MGNGQIKQYIETIRQQLVALQQEDKATDQESVAAPDDLYLIYEEMQTSLEVAQRVEEALLQQNQRIAAKYQHYCKLFYALPLSYLITDASGPILHKLAQPIELLAMVAQLAGRTANS